MSVLLRNSSVRINEHSRIVIDLNPVIRKFTPSPIFLNSQDNNNPLVWFNRFIQKLGIETIIKILFIQKCDTIDNKVLLYQFLEATTFYEDYEVLIGNQDLLGRFEILTDAIEQECDQLIRCRVLESPLPYHYSRYALDKFICPGVALFGVYEILNNLAFDIQEALF